MMAITQSLVALDSELLHTFRRKCISRQGLRAAVEPGWHFQSSSWDLGNFGSQFVLRHDDGQTSMTNAGVLCASPSCCRTIEPMEESTHS